MSSNSNQYAQTREFAHALLLCFTHLCSSCSTLTSKLKNLAHYGQWKTALSVLREAQTAAESSKASRAEGNGQANGGVKPGEGACGVIDEVGILAYNSTLAALSKGGKWKQALLLLRDMKTKGVERDTVSFASAIAA